MSKEEVTRVTWQETRVTLIGTTIIKVELQWFSTPLTVERVEKIENLTGQNTGGTERNPYVPECFTEEIYWAPI